MGETSTFQLALFGVVGTATLLVNAVISIFYGWKVYRLFTTLLTALAAAVVGWFFVAPHLPAKYACVAPIVLGLAGVAIAFPMQRVAAFVTTGVLGAIVAVIVGALYNMPLDFASGQTIAVAAAGFIVAGIPAAIFLRFFVVLTTSAWGALMALVAVAGLAFVCLSTLPAPDVQMLTVILAAWAVLTATGMVFQYRLIKAEQEEA